MPIIIFVVSIAMLLGIMTYVRIDQFRAFSTMRYHFEEFMACKEREFYTSRAVKWYNDTHVSTSDKKDEQGRRQVSATSRLSLFPLLDEETKKAQYERYAQHRVAAKKLIEYLYGDTALFKTMQEDNPNLTDNLLDAIIEAYGRLPKKQKITTPQELANLDLGDPKLNELFYKILKGSKRRECRDDALKTVHKEIDPSDREEIAADDGYISLIDFVNLDKRSKLRVYLASRPLLKAISDDPRLAEEIIQARNNLFSNMTGPASLTPEEATKHFKALLGGRISSILDETLLDYTVTKTNPKPFE